MISVAYDDGQINSQAIVRSKMPTVESFAAEGLTRIEHYGRPTPVRDVALLPGGRILAAYGGGESIDYWNLTGPEAGGRYAGDISHVTAAAICPDGRHALSGSDDGQLVYYELPLPTLRYDGQLVKLRDDLLAAHHKGDYDFLERIGRQIRQTKRISSIGCPEYSLYYSWLAEPKDSSEASWMRLFAELEAWSTAKPESTLALIALANAHIDCGWKRAGPVVSAR